MGILGLQKVRISGFTGFQKKTHELMQEKAIKFNEQLDSRGKNLDNISTEEFHEIAHHIGFRVSKDKDLDQKR